LASFFLLRTLNVMNYWSLTGRVRINWI